MFPPSSLSELNEATHEGKWKNLKAEWFLMTDKSSFHTYVKVVILRAEKEPLAVRIDWHDNSTLCFEPFLKGTEVGHEVRIGETGTFCRDCIVKAISSEMKTYNLFLFNCRTVAFMILTKICRFNWAQVEAVFDRQEIMCGLDERECVSIPEIQHYIQYQRARDKCTLF